jgi:hypothetical protein
LGSLIKRVGVSNRSRETPPFDSWKEAGTRLMRRDSFGDEWTGARFRTVQCFRPIPWGKWENGKSSLLWPGLGVHRPHSPRS